MVACEVARGPEQNLVFSSWLAANWEKPAVVGGLHACLESVPFGPHMQFWESFDLLQNEAF